MTGTNINRKVLLILLAAVTALAALLYSSRAHLIAYMPTQLRDALRGIRYGFHVQHDVSIQMPDGIELAANVYLPKHRNPRIGTVLIRLPYDKDRYAEAYEAAEMFAMNGFAVVVQDMRGRHASGGEFTPMMHDGPDGFSTIDWIVAQPWSNGRVGTFGCSALGESQITLARLRHPAHVALIAEGAGGANGTAAGRYSYFGLYEGGVFNLASGFGWFFTEGRKRPGSSRPPGGDISRILRELPIEGLVARHRRDPTDYDALLTTPLGDPRWKTWGYVTEADRFAAAALHVNSWHDQTVADTFALADLMRRSATTERARENQKVLIAPGNHCDFKNAGERGRVGDLSVGSQASWSYWSTYVNWFAYWLHDEAGRKPELPAYTVYVTGEDRWVATDSWPAAGSKEVRMFLGPAGVLHPRPDGGGTLQLRADPSDPVPTLGGPICCTGNPADRAGPVDQRPLLARADVLAFATEPLREGLRVVGPVRLTVFVSSDAPDADLVAKLVDVAPDGTWLNIQEGALRLRYRNGFEAPEPLEDGRTYAVDVDLRVTAHRFAPGHRVAVLLSGSNFPRLERNLHTGGNNHSESTGRVATSAIHYGIATPSALVLTVLPDDFVRPIASHR
jgi:uncharacterized protein